MKNIAMKKIKVETKKVEVITDILCDICGNSCVADRWVDKNGDEQIAAEYMKLDANWGFHSTKDFEEWSAHVCESCVEEHLVSLIDFNKPNKTKEEERKFKIKRLNK
jgi:hypothetical protein